jgi:hypothetical protein
VATENQKLSEAFFQEHVAEPIRHEAGDPRDRGCP